MVRIATENMSLYIIKIQRSEMFSMDNVKEPVNGGLCHNDEASIISWRYGDSIRRSLARSLLQRKLQVANEESQSEFSLLIVNRSAQERLVTVNFPSSPLCTCEIDTECAAVCAEVAGVGRTHLIGRRKVKWGAENLAILSAYTLMPITRG